MHACLYYCTLGGSTDSCDLPLTPSISHSIALHITYGIKWIYSICASPVFIKKIPYPYALVLNMLLFLEEVWARRTCGQFLAMTEQDPLPSMPQLSPWEAGHSMPLNTHSLSFHGYISIARSQPCSSKNIITLQWSQICNNPRCVFMSHRELGVTTCL